MTTRPKPHHPLLTLCELGETDEPHLETWSPYTLKVHRSLRLAGLAYGRRHVAHPGRLRPLSPVAQAPVLLVGETPVADSTEILRWVERATDGALTRGLSPEAAAEAWLWEDFADTGLRGC